MTASTATMLCADVKKINSNVGPSTGNIEHTGDIEIAGGICDLFEVRAAGNLVSAGVIGAACLHVGGNLKAVAGIAGKGTALCLVGGNVEARHISNATIESYGDISADTMIWESTVVCGGSLEVGNGSFAASRATIAGSMSCKTLGLASGAKTLVEVGVSEFVRKEATQVMPAIEKHRKKLAQVRTAVDPLVKMMKTLPASEKERVTELLFEADEIQEAINKLLKKVSATMKISPTSATPRISVEDTLFPGVTVRFPRFEATIDTTFKGPLEIVVQKVGTSSQICIVERESGSTVPLASRPVEDAAMTNLNQLLQGK